MAFLGIGAILYDYEAKNTGGGNLIHFLSRGVYDLSGRHLYDLPATRTELIEARQALGHSNRAVLSMGTAATEARFEAEPLSNFKVIHFAVHALSTPNFPERSALILGRDPHSHQNGLLRVRDIARLSLVADLVTLSSCDTGIGKHEGEEGIAEMVPAFLFAGARSVVGSLWNVDDSATELEMKQFYVHLAQGGRRSRGAPSGETGLPADDRKSLSRLLCRLRACRKRCGADKLLNHDTHRRQRTNRSI